MSRRSTSRLRALIGLTATLLATTLAATGCSSSDASGEGSGGPLNIGFISTTSEPSGPEGWAKHEQTLAPGLDDAGVNEVKWLPFKNGPDLSAAIQGGSVDLALYGDTPALTAASAGIKTRLVNQGVVGLDAVVFGQPDGATELKDLDGKKVAIQVGSYYYRYLVDRVEQLGIDVEISHVYVPDALAALQSGGIDAYVAPAGPLAARLLEEGYTAVERASDHDLTGSSLTVITEDALERFPELPKAWNEVRAASVNDLKKRADDYYAFAAEATGTTPEIVETWLPVDLYSPEPFTPRGATLLEATEQFLFDEKLTKKRVDLDAWKVQE